MSGECAGKIDKEQELRTALDNLLDLCYALCKDIEDEPAVIEAKKLL